MRPGPGWYLLRCPKCKQAFVATNLAEYCDCGNTDWEAIGPFKRMSKGRIRVEMDLEKAEGCVVVWDSKPVSEHRRVGWWVAAGRFVQWVGRVVVQRVVN